MSDLVVDRVAVEGACPQCGAAELQSYPLLGEGGWFMVVKCQECLHSVERTPWNRLGNVVRTEAYA
jgi:uncharacterized Zn finger protein